MQILLFDFYSEVYVGIGKMTHDMLPRRSSFSCNRVRVLSLTKWVVKEFENVLVPEEDRGIFYSGESYVIRSVGV